MLKNNKKIVLLTILVLVVALISGSTFAYFMWQSAENQKTNVTLTVTNGYSCTANGGGSITNNQRKLAPASCTNSTYSFQRQIDASVVSSIDDEIYMDLWLDVNDLGTGLKNSQNFKYAITTDSTSCTNGVLKTGTFYNLSVGSRAPLLENVLYSSSGSKRYYLYVWLDASETSKSTQNQIFNLSLNGECRNTINLPSQYQKVEYIESSKQQNIVLSLFKDFVMYDDVQFNSSTSRQLLSVSNGSTGAGQYWGSGENNYFDVGPNAVNRIAISTVSRNMVKITHNGSKIVLEVNGSSVERAGSVTNFKYDMFGTGSYKASLKRYGTKVYNSSGELKINLVPCYRISDGVIGMYDTINNNFYTNSGSGTFTKGANI